MCDEFSDFKDECCYQKLTIPNLSENAANKFDDHERTMIEQ